MTIEPWPILWVKSVRGVHKVSFRARRDSEHAMGLNIWQAGWVRGWLQFTGVLWVRFRGPPLYFRPFLVVVELSGQLEVSFLQVGHVQWEPEA